MRTIGQGDKVYVVMAHNRVFSWQNAPSFEAIVEYTPTAPGDTWHFDVDGKTIIINPQASDFVGLELIEKAERPL